ncbi:DNA topoisomerase [Gorgonomyces haynaldii]|nr:DNA topoisomerase [Gorgonomyces haynaldii]
MSESEDYISDEPKKPVKRVTKKTKPLAAHQDTEKTVEQIYQKKSQLEHILIRPDTYIGSTEPQTQNLWVYENDRMKYRPVSYVPGLYKIFDEIIVNAADNKVRDPSMNAIKVTIDQENNTISIYNNGRGIPIQIHQEEQVYVPELIFGHLLTSSNYDDNEKKVTGGRNGYGAKLCNIFSTEFIVETGDSKSGQKYKQVFSKNMSVKGKPVITSHSKEDFTKITFKPDLERFHMQSLDNDFVALATKRVYDMAGVCRGVKVFLNDVRIKIKDFKDYVDLYLNHTNPETGTKPPIIYEKVNDRWEVAFTPSDGQFNQVSFVNSICTIKGGTHVAAVSDQLVNHLIEAVKKKDKKGVPLKPFQAKSHLWVFVNAHIENPTFDSQTKETLTLRQSAFGSKVPLSEDFMKKVNKSGVVENILSYARFKQDQQLKKTDGHGKRSRITGLAKLDDANNAGTKNASQCTLILTEGDSAKSLAVSGLSVVGRDNFGVFPLRGKLLNVREASATQITGNAEISAIKQILGLQHGKTYENANSLRYGHLMIMTDQDHDGSHIKGLIINLIDHFWPSLLKVPGFLLEFITPIVKVTKGKGANKQEKSFFTLPEYETWKEKNQDGKGWNIKYYKGLGTSTTEDAKQYFSNMGRHLKPFEACEDEDRQLIEMAFGKKRADDRKEWLRRFQPGTYMDHRVDEIPIRDFINKELILFSMADNARSIPSSVDGLKPGQRKILFACFKRNLKAEIKVAQLAGYVSEHAAYHHGEQSLSATIVNMAQNFIGSNNLPLLEPIGQFGTRLQGGKDAASPRYIFTNLSPLARVIYHPQDDPLLAYLNDDGQSIEPEWYLPILPMLLVNGGEGIGTGWSTAIPNYNPRDVVDNLFKMMKDEEPEAMHPWYRGFQGQIIKEKETSYKVIGNITKIDNTTVEITELPLKTWTQSYKEQLESWVQGTDKTPAWIKDYKEYHTDSKVHFVVTLTEEKLKEAEKEGLEKKFKLTSSLSTSNLVCFDLEGRIRKYESVTEILKHFFDLRKEYYQKRKDYLLSELTFDLEKLENKVRFVLEIIQNILKVQNRKKKELLEELKEKKYKPIHKNRDRFEEVEEDEDETDHGYDYLLTMPIWNLTMEKVEQLKKEKQQKEQQVRDLISKTPLDLWRTDLEAFLAKWDVFEEELRKLEAQEPNNKSQAMKKGKKTLDSMMKKPKKKAGSDYDSEDFDEKPKKVVKPKKVAEKPAEKSPEVPKPVKAKPVKQAAQPKKKVEKKKKDASESESAEDTEGEVKVPQKRESPVQKEPAKKRVFSRAKKEPIVLSDSDGTEHVDESFMLSDDE